MYPSDEYYGEVAHLKEILYHKIFYSIPNKAVYYCKYWIFHSSLRSTMTFKLVSENLDKACLHEIKNNKATNCTVSFKRKS